MTQVELAEKLGCSKQLINKYKNEGMPVGSYEAAAEWYKINVPNGKANTTSEAVGTAPHPEAKKITDDLHASLRKDGTEGLLARITQREKWLFNQLATAMQKGEHSTALVLARDHANAGKLLLELEERAKAIMRDDGRLIEVEQAKQLMIQIFGVVRSQFEYVPIEYGHKVNPKDPAAGEELLRDVTNSVINAISKELEKL
jgi:transcriptional regulator with XRE-family HTH domain